MKTVLILCISIISFSGLAQTSINGTVTDNDGKVLPGANVYLKDSYDGASTNADGNYRFRTSLEGTQVLVISAVGFYTFEKEIECNGTEITQNTRLKAAISKLNAVNITAGAMEASDEKRSVVVKPLDIVTTSGALGDIVGALNTLPGTSTIGNDGRLFVRGGDATETAIFFDGLRVGNAYGTSTSGVPTRTRFSPMLFKGTFFSTGGYSAEYGQALSSALVLNTVDMPIRTQTDISLMTVGGSVSHTQTGERTSGTASLGYIDLTPYQSIIPQDFDWGRAPFSFSGEGQVRQKIGKKGLLKAFYSHQLSGLDLWQEVPGLEGRGQQIDNRYHFGNLSLRQNLSDKWLLEGGGSLSINTDEMSIDSLDLKREADLFHLKVKSTYFHNDRLSVISGGEHFVQHYSEAMPEEGLERSLKGNLSSIFTEMSYFFSSDWAVRAGIRGEADALNNDLYISPRLSAAYKLNQRSQFSAAYGLFNQDAEDNYRILNPDLQHSRAQHYIFNYLYAREGYTLRTELFYKDYDRLVSLPGEENPVNTGYGQARGFDLFFRDQKTLKNTDYWITYSFVDSERKYASFQEAVQPSYAPRHNLAIVAKHFVSSLKSQLGASWNWNDGLPYHNPNREGVQNSRTAPFSNLSLSWSYLHRQNIILHAAVTNVLGRDNIFGYRYADAPDNEGNYASLPMTQGARRFFFIGLFITLSEDKTANQLNNL
ncbi:MAG: TonB-dependent receptor [Owenweeksia sp.]